MKAFRKLTVVQVKRTMREPLAVFFMIAFAPMFAASMGFIFGNDPVPEFDGRGYLDANLVSFTAFVVAIVGFIVVPVDAVTQRQAGVLRRFRATPLSPLAYIGAEVLVRLAVSLVSVGAMLAIGIFAFDARPGGSLANVLLAFALGILAFFAAGYALAAVLPSQGVAQAVGNMLVYPLIFLSGAAVPLEVLPEDVRNVAQFSPLTQFVALLKGLWAGEGWQETWVPVVVLFGLLGVGTAIAVRFFRWE